MNCSLKGCLRTPKWIYYGITAAFETLIFMKKWLENKKICNLEQSESS